MRGLTDAESAELERRRTQFDSFLEERMPVLTDFVERIGLADAPTVLIDANDFLPAISRFMESITIPREDRVWILTRIGYFIGEWFVQRHSGCWFLNEAPDTRYFLCYVVGRFTALPNHSKMLDPFLVATEFVDSPCPRNLTELLATVDSELKSC